MSYGTPNTRLYVGNLSWDTTDETLRQALEQNGRTVTKVDIKTDAKTGIESAQLSGGHPWSNGRIRRRRD